MESKRKGSLKKLLVSVHRYTAVTSFALGGNAIAFGLFTNYGMHIYGEDLLFCWAIALLIGTPLTPPIFSLLRHFLSNLASSSFHPKTE
tara:strand:- start:812 stop:1078 length:267 start_codon:yes stop_codon:yes gene_type:complete